MALNLLSCLSGQNKAEIKWRLGINAPKYYPMRVASGSLSNGRKSTPLTTRANVRDGWGQSGVSITPTKLINKKTWKEGWYSKPDFITTGYIKKMEVGISFRQFLKTKEQLAYKFYFFKDGLKGEGEEITDDISPVLGIENGTEKTPPKININVEIPKEYTDQYTNNSILMIVSALSIGEGEFYPTSYSDETRLLGSYVSVLHTETEKVRRWGRSTEVSLPQSKMAIEPLNKLLSGEGWKN
ncbi:hypothetical protein [Saccharicrinis aurantiacus]|uniref:hypothetical protein n=1 Tax=Saccharicrinis aurantiacus TaxID=1849719 RepID=UPI0024933528|nr:hypothetical protein [Saccharicrinis aurantiacus]